MSNRSSFDTHFETRNRKLENFLYIHDIHFSHFKKDADNMTVWVYEDTDELRRVVAEFKEISERRERRRLSLKASEILKDSANPVA